MVGLGFHSQQIFPLNIEKHLIVTSIISELHALNIPSRDPYKRQNDWQFHVFNPNLMLNFDCRGTNISVYGLDAFEIKQIKYIK